MLCSVWALPVSIQCFHWEQLETIVWWIWWWIGFGRVLNCKFHLGIVFILVVCFTRVPYVVNKCFIIAARFQQHLLLTILGMSWEKVKKKLIPIFNQKINSACYTWINMVNVAHFQNNSWFQLGIVFTRKLFQSWLQVGQLTLYGVCSVLFVSTRLRY